MKVFRLAKERNSDAFVSRTFFFLLKIVFSWEISLLQASYFLPLVRVEFGLYGGGKNPRGEISSSRSRVWVSITFRSDYMFSNQISWELENNSLCLKSSHISVSKTSPCFLLPFQYLENIPFIPSSYFWSYLYLLHTLKVTEDIECLPN